MKLRISFDSIIYRLQSYGGATDYWRNLVNHIKQDSRFEVSEISPGRLGRYERFIPVLGNGSFDIFHSSHFRNPLGKSCKVVTTVHDLTYELGYLGNGLGSSLNIAQRKASYFKADGIICISDNTRRDLLDIYPELSSKTIITIHHGIDTADFFDLDAQTMSSGYALYVGARHSYKSFDNAVLGFSKSKFCANGGRLICTGAEFGPSEIEFLMGIGLESQVISVGKVSKAQLAGLYKNAFALIYSSSYEGFGLPLLEAMLLGCPVVAKNASCIPEILSGAGLLYDSPDIVELSGSLDKLMCKDYRSAVIRAGLTRSKSFSLEKSIEKHKEFYLTLKGYSI